MKRDIMVHVGDSTELRVFKTDKPAASAVSSAKTTATTMIFWSRMLTIIHHALSDPQ